MDVVYGGIYRNKSEQGFIGEIPLPVCYIYFPFHIIFTILILPLFIRVYQLNIDKERATSVFEVVSHFYWIVKVYYALWIAAISSSLLMVKVVDIVANYIITVIVCVAVVSMVALALITEVNHLLLSLLAIQRFFMYFVPRSSSLLAFSEENLKLIITYCYGTFFAKEFIIVLWYLETSDDSKDKPVSSWQYSVPYMISNVFLMLSGLLYIPIVISLRNYRHLASAQLNQPQRYAFWQLVVIILEKCFYLSVLFFCFQYQTVSIVAICKFVDAVYMPLVIQMSYLGCNRRNLQTLYKSIKSKNVIRVMFCPLIMTTEIAPTAVNYSMQVNSTVA